MTMRGDCNRNLVGDFYVDLTQSIFGGEITAHDKMDNDRHPPDIIDYERNKIFEVKGTNSGDVHKINPSQVRDYESWRHEQFPLCNPEVYYCLWEYAPRYVAEFSEEEINHVLLERTSSLLVLSLDVVCAGVTGDNPWKKSGSNGWPAYHMCHSSTRSLFHSDPLAGLRGLCLFPGDFNIRKQTVEGKHYKQGDVNPFTMTVVHHKNQEGIIMQ